MSKPKEDVRKKVIRLVLRGVEVDNFEQIQTELCIHNPAMVLQTVLATYLAYRTAYARKPVGRPKGSGFQLVEKKRESREADREYEKDFTKEVTSLSGDALQRALFGRMFFDFWREVIWKNDPVWKEKKIFNRETPDGLTYFCVDEGDLFERGEIATKYLKKFFKWRREKRKENQPV